MRFRFSWLLYLLGFIAIFVTIIFLKDRNGNIQARPRIDRSKLQYTKSLATVDDFLAFQGEPLTAKFNEVLSVKLVLDKKSGELYFLNHRFYQYHFEFCVNALGFKGSLGSFNTLNYIENDDQLFYLANLNYYKSQKKYAIELTSSTIYKPESLKLLYRKIRENSFIKDSLYILIGSGYLMDLAEGPRLGLPKLYPDEIYKNQEYQLLQSGVAYGYLKAVENLDASYMNINPSDIILIKGTPLQIPLCAAIITETFQTPLSHIQILARNRKIPSAVLKSAWQQKEFNDLVNQPVKLTLSTDGYLMERCSKEEVVKYLKQKQQTKTVRLKANYNYKDLPEGTGLRLKSIGAVGMKAAALGELQFLSKKKSENWKVPEGLFAIPFYYYQEHMKQPGIQTALHAVKEDLNTVELRSALKHLRNTIRNTPINPQLLKMVDERIVRNKQGYSYRFRSSSNAEDLDGFSGAGLYTSKTGVLNDPTRSIEAAVKAVWASAWSDAAYMERKIHGIDQNTVAMGIVCHRNFPAEAANGVAITKNLYRPDFNGFTINVQPGEHSVVEPDSNSICEQLILMPESNIDPQSYHISADYISYSSYTYGRRVLDRTQLESLYDALNEVKAHFFLYTNVGGGSNNDFYDYGLDIEFKFENNGDLYLKQVRFYP